MLLCAIMKKELMERSDDKMDNKTKPVVTIKIQNKGDIKIELYPDKAPNTVNNFISLVKKGFYNNLIFHRVIPGFMVQGGLVDLDTVLKVNSVEMDLRMI